MMLDKIIKIHAGCLVWLSDVYPYENYIGWIDGKGQAHFY